MDIFISNFCEIGEPKLKNPLFLFTSLVLFPLIAMADLKKPSSYIEIGGAGLTVKDTSLPGISWKPTAAKLTFGKNIANNLALEFTVGSGVNSSTVNFNGVPVNTKIGLFYAVYLRPSIPLGDSAEFFARVGYLRGKTTVSIPGILTSESVDSSFSYGAGLAIKVTDNLSATADYMQYYNVDGTTVNGFGAGLKSDF